MNKNFAKNFKNLRINGGYYQNELATEFNVSQNTIHKWENGSSEPTFEMLLTISEYFKISTDSLLGLEPPPTIFAKTPALEPDERKLLEAYHELTPGKKKALFQMLDIGHSETKSDKVQK